PISTTHALRRKVWESFLASAASVPLPGLQLNELPIEVSATQSEGTAGTDDALSALAALVHDDIAACNAVILRQMQSPVALIPQLAAYIVAAGGKRLRPLLTLACARLCGYRGGQRHVDLAACVEFIHTATLLHDDVVDESALRRGLASANAVFGNKAS